MLNVARFGTTLDAVQYHNQLADDWDRRYEKPSFRSRLIALGECLEGWDLNGTEWLDAGCGTGTLSRWLAGQGCTVLGVDAAQRMVDAATTLAASRNLHRLLRFERVDSIARLPLSPLSADGVVCSSVLEYVPDPDACLTEFGRVLRPGGILLVSVPNTDSWIRRSQKGFNRLGKVFGRQWAAYLNYSKHQYALPVFERTLTSKGFHVNTVVALGGPLPQWLQRARILGPLLMFSATKV